MKDTQKITQLLAQHNWVSNCVVHIRDPKIFAWVELSHQGIDVFRNQGRSTVVDQLAEILIENKLPKYWRFSDKIEDEPIDLTELDSLFQDVTEPNWLKNIKQNEIITLFGKVPLDLIYFEGHFAHFPLVPGVIELQWIIDQIRRLFEIQNHILRVDNLKFQKFLRPNDDIVLILKWEKEKSRVVFQLKTEDEMCASGSVIFSTEK